MNLASIIMFQFTLLSDINVENLVFTNNYFILQHNHKTIGYTLWISYIIFTNS